MLTESLLENYSNQAETDQARRQAAGCVHELFERQAARTPAAPALRFGDQVLSYEQLNRRANRLARHLRGRRDAAPTVVGICLERGIDAIVAVIAALKAGAAYAPIDPAYPAERQAYILRDSQVGAVISGGELVRTLPADCDAIDLDGLDLDHLAADNLGATCDADDLAYLIYTSGSTGAPKGVCMPHRALVNLLVWQLDEQGDYAGRKTVQFSPLSFDVSFQEIFATLASGGELVLIPNRLRLDPLALLAFIETERVERIFLPYVALNSLAVAAAAQERYPRSLIDVVTAGEQLVITAAIRQFFDALPRCRLHNHYGPSESHVVTAYTLTGPVGQWPTLPSIGTPVANVDILLRDAQNREPAVGEPGELCIAGAQLAYGYHRRPQETAERFVEIDLDGKGPKRLYRTGDLARRQADGLLEILGRIDDQIKIRGYRVEPCEVEALLMRHPAVCDAAVVAQGDNADNKRLVAFVIGAESALQSQSETEVKESIRRYLEETAPDYLRPAALVLVGSFPLAASGKIDRRAFPAVEADAAPEQDFAPARTPVEEALVEVWSELLGKTGIGRHAHFFKLGGHSLLIIKAMLALHRRGFVVDADTLYQYPVLSELASRLRRQERRQRGAAPAEAETTALAGLSPAERAALAEAVPGGLANIKEVCPLGPLQQGMFYHALAHPEGDPYVLWQVARFDSEDLLHSYLDALHATIARHDALRVGIVHQGLSQPLQVVWREAAPQVEALRGETAMAELKRRCEPALQRFDIARAPLQRCVYCHDAETGQWVLLHQLHHLAVDHATVERMQQEIEDRLLGRELAPLATVSLSQARAGFVQEGDEAERKAFFDALLGDFEPGSVPLDASAHLAGDAVVIEGWRRLQNRLGEQIREQARAHGVSVATVFHLAWAKVVASLSGRDDVVFGTVLLGRMRLGEAAQNAMGQFINTLPMRLRMDQGSVLECLQSAQDALVQLLKHEQAPLALAQKSAQIQGATPLFTTLFNYRHSEIDNVPSADPFRASNPSPVAGISYSGCMERTTYPISVNVDDFATGLVVNVQVEQGHDPERVCDYFETALQEIVGALEGMPGKPAGRLSAMPASERDRIVRQWNDTAADFPEQACLHELIEAQARRTPDAIAVEFGDDALSYAQLNRRANRLARYLSAELGVGPDAVVGVCAERSLEMVVALLAVIKAGGAYAPLDPHYPGDRLHYMLRDAAPKAVLSHGAVPASVGALLAEYAGETGAVVVDLDADEAWAKLDDTDLSVESLGLDASHLAYVIYTSGSTGRPKGVMNEHRGVVNRLVWMQKAYPLDGRDAVLQKTPFSFDVSVWEFFWPLMYGARLVVAKPEGHKDPGYLSELILARGVTTLHFVPSMLSAFLDHAAADIGGGLRQVFCSGEALPAHSVRRFRERFPTVELHNLYGPTEAAIDVSFWDCRREAAGGVIPIGRPIDNIRLYILDAHGQPCPVGVAGELHIAGVGVARGYLNKPELTAEKFVEEPFHAEGGRMYRTGDLARYLPDGEIDYLGRNDFQVKLRGFRIELGDIEAALLSHPAVKECVVLARQDTPGDARLVAYVTRTGAEDEATQAVREHLQARLPAFMVPTNILWLDALPLTGNGKLDRKALPSPADAALPAAATQAPATATETRLAQLWRDLLKHEAIGRQTHFFEAGGHSLLAVALMTRIQGEFGLSLPLSAIVAHLDLASQAALIDSELARGVAATAPTETATTTDGIRALPAQKAIYKAVRLAPHDLSNNSFIALAFDAEPDLKALRNLLQTVFSRHESLSAKFALDGDELFLRPAPRFLFRLEKRQTLGSLEEDLRDFVRPFSLEDGLNVRGRWVTDGPQPLLLLDFSHACIDGAGLARIVEELADDTLAGASLAAYSGLFHSDGFAVLRREHADFWRARLQDWSGAPARADLSPQTHAWQVAIDSGRKAQIEALAARLKISLPEFFMAVFLGFKARLEGHTDQLVSMIFHGRDRLEQQAVIAPLMTVLPVRVGLPETALTEASLRDVSAAVRDACRHYLFDAEALAAQWPELPRAALFPSAFFGYFQRDGFSGQIAGQPCRQVETPNIAGGQQHWNLTCEIVEHDAGFEARLEALSHQIDGNAEYLEKSFKSLLDVAIDFPKI